jgi:hypothetical protein
LGTAAITVSSASGLGSGFAGDSWTVTPASPSSTDPDGLAYLGLINPAAGGATDVLATVLASDPTGTQIVAPIAIGNKAAGSGASPSTVVYVGYPIEEATAPGSKSTPYDFFSAVNRYVTGK